jgi:DNA-binding XRE family transcriptional regulator
MIFGFYNKRDKTQETIGRTVGLSRLEAAKYFAERKQLSLKEFLKIFGVKTII